MPAFRREVHAERERSALGSILLIRPLSFSALTVATLAIVGVVFGYLGTAEYGRKARLAGTLVPEGGGIRVDAPYAARLTARHASEGERVKVGSPLARLEDVRATMQGDAVSEASRRLAHVRMRELQRERTETEAALGRDAAVQDSRLASLEAERGQLDREAVLLARRESLAEADFERFRLLEARGIVTAAQRSQHEDRLLEHRSRGEALRRTRLLLERDIEQARQAAAQSRSQAGARLAALDARSAEASLADVERESRTQSLVLAPAEGIVSTWVASEGQSVGAGETLVSILPVEARLEAQFLAPSHAIGLLRPGQAVRLRYSAYPYQRYGSHAGRVLSVSTQALGLRELASGGHPGAVAPLFRVRVALERQHVPVQGEAMGLRPGLAVEADVEVDRRRLVEWALEPLFAIAGKLS